jgi:hypothetical protein
MTATRRSVMWPLLVIAVGCIWLLVVAGAVPEAVRDLLIRAWPALLVLFGLDVLVGQRRVQLRRWTIRLNWAALLGLLVLLAVLIWLAYEQQTDQLRTDQVVPYSRTLDGDIERVRVVASLERTTVTVRPATQARQLQIEFTGSKESEVTITPSVEDDTTLIVTVDESYKNAIPKLEDIGRATLDITLPPAVYIDQFRLTGDEGDVLLDMQGQPLDFEFAAQPRVYLHPFAPLRTVTQLSSLLTPHTLSAGRIEVGVNSGDLTLNLPDYFGPQDALSGLLKTNNGDITVRITADVPLSVTLAEGSGEPRYEYDSGVYDVLRSGQVKMKNTTEFQVGLTVSVESGAPLVIDNQ